MKWNTDLTASSRVNLRREILLEKAELLFWASLWRTHLNFASKKHGILKIELHLVKNKTWKLQIGIVCVNFFIWFVSLAFLIMPIQHPFPRWSFSSLGTREAGAEWAAPPHCSSSKRKLNMSVFISNQGSGLALSYLLVRIYADRNNKHLNKKSKREWVWLLLHRAGLADPVFIKGLFEQPKANGFMLSHVRQPHDVTTQERTMSSQKEKDCTETLKVIMLLCSA